jgi:dTDP-4-amino-4,6-dideoxygalactose transaminase
MMVDLPALLGGKPFFAEKINIVRPELPNFTELSSDVSEILQTGMVTKGHFLAQFEEAIASHLGVKHAVAVSSCTSGLMLSQRALGLTGDVVVPSFTFMATVSSLVWNNLHPVFADVDRKTTNLDPEAAEAAITPATTAILAVHNFGNPADIAELEAVARRHGIHLIFDAAHGFGALYQNHPVGKQGEANIFSMSPTKLLITGEGGLVATDDDVLAEKIRIGREYGNNGHYDSLYAGLNARMPEFNAILGLRSLERLEEAATVRNNVAGIYHEVLGRMPGLEFQSIKPEDRCSYKDFSFTVDENSFGLSRDMLFTALEHENIDVRKYYDPPAHRHIAYRELAGKTHLPNTEWLSNHILSIPIWSNMDEKTVLDICEAVNRIYRYRDHIQDFYRNNN